MLTKDNQQVLSTREQIYVSCQACGYKQNLQPSDLADPSRVICHGHDCKNALSVKEGIKNAIVSDNDFMAWCFISDTMITGSDIVRVGIAKEIELKTPIKVAKKVFVTQVSQLEPHGLIYFNHKVIPPDSLIIICSGSEQALGKTCEVSWVVYADVESATDEPWREYLQRSKESVINHNYQSAIVEAEIAVEVTIATVTWELLVKRKKLNEDVAEWILNKAQAASERAKRVMELAIGKKISDIDPIVYKSWVRNVAQKRNRIVHQGESATKEEALNAIGSAFEFIWLLLELVNKHPV